MRGTRRKRAHHHGEILFDLPVELQTRILGMLSTKDSAAATLVSKKLMPAFSSLTNLVLEEPLTCHCYRNNSKLCKVKGCPNFKKFVDYVFKACQSEELLSYRLGFGCRNYPNEQGRCCPELEPARLNAWISFPLARRVRELDLYIYVKSTPECPNKLPRSIFVCETLEMLKIDSNLDLDVDDVNSFPIRLPHLKLLHLRKLTKDYHFVTKLVKSCPLLEELLLNCKWNWGDKLIISSPSLLKLDLRNDMCGDIIFSSHISIETPNLKSFTYKDYLAKHYYIPDMTALVHAEITIIFPCATSDESCRTLCSILKSCSTVSHLSLLSNTVMCLDNVLLKNHLPVFSNLNHLELECSSVTYWDNVFVQFLECCPSLETLVFPEGLVCRYSKAHGMEDGYYELERECWRTTQAISCCKSHLKKIVIKSYYGSSGRERDLIQFLLEKALVLESLVISPAMKSRSSKVVLSSIKRLKEMPRASEFCSIRID